MAVKQASGYNIDVVLCIDKTGSMAPIIYEFQRNALNFYKMVTNEMDAWDHSVNALRVKVIGFGDYDSDNRPMMISKFFTLPDESNEFEAFLNGINAGGGGDAPENALEALAHAIKSDWTEDGIYRRHVIMMFTDAPALKLGARTNFENDDERIPMPADLVELGEWWEEMEFKAKRCVLFAPDCYPWGDLAVNWENVGGIPVGVGTGCDDIDLDDVSRMLIRSVTQGFLW